MKSFTAFCQSADGTGTIWIDGVEAENADAAVDAAVAKCAAAWEVDADDVHCLGIAEGDVKILYWNDLNDD